MKKGFLSIVSVAALSALMLCSCQKENDTVSFNATISTYGNTGKDSKTYIDANRYCNWIDGDKVMINGVEKTVSVSGSGENRVATIAGVATSTNGYYAYYPAAGVLTNSTSGFPEVLLPQVQNYLTDVNGNQRVEAPMAAYCPSRTTADHSLNFTNLCALLKIQLPSAMEVAYITVSSSNKPLWGKAAISGTTQPTLGTPNIADLSATDNTVTLDFTNNGSTGSDGSSTTTGTSSTAAQGVTSAGPFYIVLPPATQVSDLTINIYVFNDSNSSQQRRTVLKYTKSADAAVSIVANKLYVTGDLPEEGVEVPDAPYPNLGSGEFSVGRNKKVRFALGNLQWQGSTNTWRFAANQWDYIGQNPGNTNSASTTGIERSTQTAWIDLFGYGTSGYNNHFPYRTAHEKTYYANRNISNTTNDWGVNAIINGGNQPNKWRTLTEAEWKYLIGNGFSRSNANNLHIPRAYITISSNTSILGTIIFPDGYTGTTPDNGSYITVAQWNSTYAPAGAIFLPAAGQRNIQNYSDVNTKGYYWTSTYDSYNSNSSNYRGKQIWFDSDGDHFDNMGPFTYMGNSVRLVRDVN